MADLFLYSQEISNGKTESMEGLKIKSFLYSQEISNGKTSLQYTHHFP